MPVFEYTGRTPTGQTVSGTLEAKNKQELMQLLRRQRVIVTNVKRKSKSLNLTIGTGVKAVEISRFTRQFAVMIEAGLPLVQCLDILAAQTTNKVLAKIIANVRDTVSSGSTLADALAKEKKVFDQLYVSMIEAGEVGGALDVILKRLADYREKADAIKRKIKGALTYPAIMLVMLVLISFVMLTFVIPIFAGMFEGLGAELPKPTQIVINLSNWLKGNMHFLIGGVILIIIIYKLMRKNSKTRYYLDYLFLKLPLFGMLIRKTAVARFSRTLGTLIQSGVNIIDALQVTAKTAGNDVIARAIKNAIIAISQGETIARPLEESRVFPPMVVQMINVGEKTGNLDTMLAKIADFYEEEVDSAVETLTAMIEPLMTVVMGIVVGGLLVAMYLPMFDIIGKIKA
ncbi:MAG TPA: type II secretion system F family protein [candidate division Zixibacteria bacterium]|nr:type II secretion system F family protein [candidate division Zixibacteria bacterium]